MKGGNMFYKHWKKIALSLTAFFWASCEDSVTSTAPEYGCPDDGCGQGPIDNSSSSNDGSVTSSSSETSSSSSSDIAMSMPLYGVSETLIYISSSSEESSSSFTEVAPAYGVPGKLSCYEDPAGRKYDGSKVYRCDDGVTCQEEAKQTWKPEYECVDDICPDYGVVSITETTYTCDDGKVYNYAEFVSRYNKFYAQNDDVGK